VDKWLNHPTAIKLISLVVGIIMWTVVHFDPESSPNNVASLVETRTVNDVKIEVTGLNERSFLLKSIEPETVKLTVRGIQSDIRLARKEDYHISVDLSGLSEGVHSLSPRLDLPRGIQLVEINPGTVTVTIEALHTQEFEVNIRTQGTPAEGYIAGAPIIKPTNRAHVTLPENELARVRQVGAVISIEGEKEAVRKKSVKLAAFDEAGNVIEGAIIDPAAVEVEIPITFPYKTVPIQLMLSGSLPPGLSIGNFTPDAEQATVYGPRETLEQIELAEATLQLSQLSQSGKVEIPLATSVPVNQISPEKIVVDVEVVLSDTRTLEGLPINWRGLGEGLAVRILEPSTGKADIVVRGSPARLGSLRPGDVTVVADLTGKGPGTHELNLVVNAPRFIERSGGTAKVTVEIFADEPAAAEPEEGAAAEETVDEEAADEKAESGTDEG
jgi:YbbR domain-containing protein